MSEANCAICSSCGICALCLADGPIPDFEGFGTAALYGLFSW
ncbi:MAG: subtilosin A family bacteriocin [Candidatus Omnitrophica bacterium]|nr:subtilosin A family bacteriocin [Candidatus Omnitrophota bacterium]